MGPIIKEFRVKIYSAKLDGKGTVQSRVEWNC